MRPLRYWNGTRCCRFLALAKTRAQRRYPQRSRPSEQRRPAPKAAQPYGREAEGEAAVAAIEKRFIEAGVDLAPVPEGAAIRLRSRTHTSLREVFDSPQSALDRDRGTPRDATPPTPPGIRVRTTAVRPS